MTRKRYIEGVDQVSRVFKALPRKSAEEIAHALNLGAKEIADAAELLVPVDTAELKQDIQIETTGPQIRSDNRAVVARVIVGTRKDTAEKAFRQEFGRARGPGKHPGHDPQSFFFTAYYAKRKRVRSRVARAINKAAKAMARVR